MRTLIVAATLAAVASSPVMSAPLTPVLQPAVDSPGEREALRKFALCFAEQRPRWARNLLAQPYLSTEQAGQAAIIVSGRDHCLKAAETALTFRTSTVVGVVAEHFLTAELPSADPKRLSSSLATAAPLNSSEDFALCVASRNPAAAIDMIRSDPGSEAEAAAATSLAGSVPSCTKPDEKLDVDVQALRSLAATALYRSVSAASVP